MKPPARQGAFTLIETVLALAVFAVAITILAQAITGVFRSLENLDNTRSVEADVRTARQAILRIPDRETFEDGDDLETARHGNAEWETEIEETEVVDLFKATIRIELQEAPEGQRVHETNHYLLRPGWAEGSERAALLQERREAILDQRNRTR